MYKKQIELELQVAYEWAITGDIDRTMFHVNLASQYLKEFANHIHQQYLEEEKAEQLLHDGEMKYWQHGETGRVVGTPEKPPGEWTEITKAQYRQIAESRS
jgi:hypothetical protein